MNDDRNNKTNERQRETANKEAVKYRKKKERKDKRTKE
jgi:hypothetical protein